MTIIYKNNIERQTLQNNFYRKVLNTTPQQQLVLMTIPKDQDIGMEVHPKTTQFIRVEAGTGVAYIAGKRYNLKDGDAIVIPPNTKHNIRATSELRLYTIYSPPEHPRKTVQRHKIDENHN